MTAEEVAQGECDLCLAGRVHEQDGCISPDRGLGGLSFQGGLAKFATAWGPLIVLTPISGETDQAHPKEPWVSKFRQ